MKPGKTIQMSELFLFGCQNHQKLTNNMTDEVSGSHRKGPKRVDHTAHRHCRPVVAAHVPRLATVRKGNLIDLHVVGGKALVDGFGFAECRKLPPGPFVDACRSRCNEMGQECLGHGTEVVLRVEDRLGELLAQSTLAGQERDGS